MKTKTFQNKSRLVSLFLSLVIMLTFGLSMLSPLMPRASAADGSKNDIADKVFSFQAYLMMSGQCVWTSGDGALIASDPATWMQTSNVSGFNKNKSVGSAFMQSLGIDGSQYTQADCDDTTWINKALSLWGFSQPGDFLAAMLDVGALKYNDATHSYSTLDANDHTAEWSGVKKVLTSPKYAKYYSAGASLGGISSDEKYYDALVNFKDQCRANFSTSKDAATTEEQVTAQTQAYLDGKLTTGYWHYYKSDANSQQVGTALVSGGKMNCTDLAGLMLTPGLISAYSNYIKAGGVPLDGSGSSAASGSTTDAKSPSLDCQAGWNPLNWLICGIVTGLVSVVNQLDNFIIAQMAVGTVNTGTASPSLIFGNTASAKAYHDAWASFRNIALALMVVAGLVVIISQALGFEILDAYTIRKVMPRFIAVAVFITLSWSIMEFMVTLTNAVGYGIRGIIYAPFNAAGLNFSLDFGGAGGVAVALLAAGAITALGIIGLLSFAVTAALAVFVAYLTLVIRQILIVALIIIAPIAIAAYILPNTQRIYKIWWESFSKALLMFPMIMAIIATGHVFAAVAANSTPKTAISQFIAFTAYFAPYFLIPATFKFAGGALGRIGGLVNDRGRGSFDRLRNFRGHRVQSNMERIRAGSRFEGGTDTNLRGRINRGLQAGSNVGRLRMNPTRWGAQLAMAGAQISEQQRDQMLEDKDYTWKGDDELNRAAAETTNAGELRNLLSTRYAGRYVGDDGTNLNRDVERVEQLRRKYGSSSFRQAAWQQAVAGGTAYKNSSEMWEAAAGIAGNDNGLLASLVAKGRNTAMGAGRADQGGAGFSDTLAVAQKYRELGAATTDTDREALDYQLTNDVFKAQGPAVLSHFSMKKKSVENMVPVIQKRLSDAVASGDEGAYQRELASVANLYDTLASTSPQNAEVIAKNVLDWDPQGTGPLPEGQERRFITDAENPYGPLPAGQVRPQIKTIRQDIELNRGSEQFQTMRREMTAAEDARRRMGGPSGPPTANPGGAPGGLPPGP